MSRDDRNLVRLLVIGIFCVLTAGCSQSDKQRQAEMEKLRAFLQEKRSPVVGVPYRVLPPDTVGISSKYVREIDNIRQRVRPDGKITLPLLGDVFVAGKTTDEISYEIAWAARRYYSRVDVTVQVVDYNSQKVFVFGQVSRAGAYAWTGADTVLDVLAEAQPTMLAWPENIRVVRGQSPQRGGYEQSLVKVGGPDEAKELTINLMDMLRSGDMSHNVLLRPDDIVYVPANIPGSIGLTLRQLMYPVQPAMEGMWVPKNAYRATKIKDDDDGYDY